ncbi:MAG: helix-turn-helix transcriptional regulator [Bacteroidetes bacterium]|jgi:ArsR family transcriptional regulator|nr:helix-turn-helix transcriptional regulator [Bacteroidota bacterium]MBK9523957.1 helix-turn-helix transcriptional regulator [Bacteroidota bacterium]MBK9541698.1 helix-turn-helix transcriptional regulator [Bacteroidota bacterium]MBL0258403.1 helix-turn-helix transcriptional regulator [Bacteroidota bacterium]MBP6403707.1 helix-turn-helix transcriptional regulator [Bacteroidia bacterium]
MIKLNKNKLEKAAYILKTIAHPTRLSIIHLLEENDRMSVNELCSVLGCEQSLVSHHLSNMRIKGLLKSEREGINIYYSLKEKELAKIVAVIEHCHCNM